MFPSRAVDRRPSAPPASNASPPKSQVRAQKYTLLVSFYTAARTRGYGEMVVPESQRTVRVESKHFRLDRGERPPEGDQAAARGEHGRVHFKGDELGGQRWALGDGHVASRKPCGGRFRGAERTLRTRRFVGCGRLILSCRSAYSGYIVQHEAVREARYHPQLFVGVRKGVVRLCVVAKA